MSLIKRVSGIIFVAGEEGVTLVELVKTLDQPKAEVKKALNDLELSCRNNSDCPVELTIYSERYLFITKEDLSEDVKNYAQAPFSQKLSRAAVETLAIIAYRQPITRIAIDEVRGVNSQGMIQTLIDRDLVVEIGRLDAPGRPYLYGVSDYFMNYFGLESLDNLPEIEPLALNTRLASEELFDLKEWSIEYNTKENSDDEEKSDE